MNPRWDREEALKALLLAAKLWAWNSSMFGGTSWRWSRLSFLDLSSGGVSSLIEGSHASHAEVKFCSGKFTIRTKMESASDLLWSVWIQWRSWDLFEDISSNFLLYLTKMASFGQEPRQLTPESHCTEDEGLKRPESSSWMSLLERYNGHVSMLVLNKNPHIKSFLAASGFVGFLALTRRLTVDSFVSFNVLSQRPIFLRCERFCKWF